MKIVIKTIPYKEQRYDTAGDYWLDKKGTIQVRVNKMSDEKSEFLVVVHELIEAFLSRYRGISWNDIDKWDKEFNKKSDEDEPGDDKKAPYHKEHELASRIEEKLSKELKMTFREHNKIVYDSCT